MNLIAEKHREETLEEISLWGHLVSRIHGEVPATTLEAYRRASLGVYEMLDHTETKRQELQLGGQTIWTAPHATQSEILCAWNAYALQLLGDKFMDADFSLNPATRGYLPPVTADQVLAFYSQVEGWLSRARQAHSNPTFQLDVQVPADLPPWSDVEPCPNAHLHGMLEAMRHLRDHAGIAMSSFESAQVPEGKDKAAGYARQLWAEAKTKADYAENLWGGDPSRDLHERIEEQVKIAIEKLYRLGQLLAMPPILESAAKAATVPRPKPAPVTPSPDASYTSHRVPGPGEPGFDPWCLTDPDVLRKMKADAEARQAVARLWKLDPDPTRTVAILSEVRTAFANGDISYVVNSSGVRLGHFFCCPWSPVYVVRRPVTLGGTQLRTLQQFVYDVNCEGYNLGRPFVRRIMIGTFHATDEMEYGDPDEAPDH